MRKLSYKMQSQIPVQGELKNRKFATKLSKLQISDVNSTREGLIRVAGDPKKLQLR